MALTRESTTTTRALPEQFDRGGSRCTPGTTGEQYVHLSLPVERPAAAGVSQDRRPPSERRAGTTVFPSAPSWLLLVRGPYRGTRSRPARSYRGGMPDLSPRSSWTAPRCGPVTVLAVDAGWPSSASPWRWCLPTTAFGTFESWAYLAWRRCCTALALRRAHRPLRPWPPWRAAGVPRPVVRLLTTLVAIGGLVGATRRRPTLRPWRAVGFVLVLALGLGRPVPAAGEPLGRSGHASTASSGWTAVALVSCGRFRGRGCEEFARVVEHARCWGQRAQEVRLAALDERTASPGDARRPHSNVIVAQADGALRPPPTPSSRCPPWPPSPVGRESMTGCIAPGRPARRRGRGSTLARDRRPPGLIEEYRAGLGPPGPARFPTRATRRSDGLGDHVDPAASASRRSTVSRRPGQRAQTRRDALRPGRTHGPRGEPRSSWSTPSRDRARPRLRGGPSGHDRRGPGHGLVGMRERVGCTEAPWRRARRSDRCLAGAR